ncbi:uncharacterized protein LOC108669576 isoform X3 [Hyalella azteca]|uniref:Uncharacterized protein LOC108669576 isoform X3 n=1 Tax=Hyalella azteca TaxID=294128 RepID=A0A979FHA2_HYAAZ|nr:uncharacterized protein LOC108669576 isoform X3 [Hyalella azteca]
MATPYFYLDEDSSQDDNQSPIPHADEILNNGCGENLDTKSTRLRKKVALTAPQLDGLFYYDHHLSKQDASLEANRFQPDSSDIVNQSQHSESYNSRCSFSFAGSTVPQSSLLHLSMGASFSSQLSSTHLTHSVVRNDVSGDPAILVYWDLINELLDEQNWKRLEQLAASLRDITDLLLSDTTWLSLDFQSLSELISVFALLVLDEKLTNFNVVSEPQSPSKSKKSTGSRKLAHIPDEFKGSLPSGGASHATPSEMGNIPVTDSMEIANNLEDAGTSTGIFPISVNSENMTGGSTAAHNNVATSSVKSDMLATCSTKSTCPARMITANPADALAAAATEASDNIGLSTDNTSGLAVTPTMIKALPKNDQPISESAKKEVSFAEPRCVVLDEPVQRPVSPTGSGGSNAVLETNHEDEWKNHVISQLLIVYDLLQKVHHVRIFERHVPISLAACFGYAKHYGPSAPAASNTCSNCKTSLSSGPSTVSTSLLPYHLSPNLCQACQTRDTPGSLPTCFPFPYINLQCMRSLQSLNINRVPWHKIHGLSCHRSRRLRYIMMRRAGMTSLEQLAAHCCADQAQKQAWHHLLELDVSYNPLRTLDSSVCLFPNITALHLTHCDLTTAEGLQQMTARLTFLDLSYNKLSTVPGLSASCCQSLLTLRIVANFIVSLRGLARLESLEHLELQDNLILMSGSLAPLGCLSELRSLRLAGNPVCYVRDSRYAIVSRLHPKVNDLKIILDERRLTNDEAALVASKNWIFVRQEACVTAGTDPVMSPEVVLRAQQAALPPSDSRLLPVLRPIDGPVRPKRKRSTKRTRLVEIAEPMGDEPQGDSTGVSYSSGTSPSETGIASCSSHPPSSNSASAGSPRDLSFTSNRGSSGNSRGLKARNAPPASYECRVIEYCPPFFYERRPLNAACHNSGRYYGASSPPREEDDAMDQTLHCDSRWSLRRMECVISISGRVMVETSDDCKQGFKVVFTQLRSVAVMADTRLRVTFCDPHHNVLHRTYELLPHVLQSLMKHFRLLLADSKLQFKVNDALTCQHCQHVFSSSLTVSVEGFPHALCPDCGWTTDGQQVDLHLVNATLREQQRVVCSIFPGVGPLLPICSQPCSHSLCSVAAARRSARCNSAINLQNFRDPLMRSLSVNSLTSSSFSIDQSAATLGYPSYYNRQNKKSSNGNISTGFETNLSSYPYDGLFDDPNLTCAPAHVISASLDAIAKKASCPVTAGGLSAIAHSQNRVVHRSQKLNEVNSSESFPTDRVLSKSADEQIADFIKQKLASTSPPNSLCRRNNSTHRQNHLRLSGTLGMSQQSLQNRTILMDTSMTTEPIDFGKPVSGIRASTQSLTPSPVVAPRHERVGLARAELAECQPLFQNLTDSVQVQKLSGSCTPGGRNAQQEAKVFLSKREMDKSKWNKENMRPMLGWMPNTVATIAEPNCYSEQLHASISRGGHDYELRKHSVSLLYSDDHSSVAARDVLRQRLVT